MKNSIFITFYRRAAPKYGRTFCLYKRLFVILYSCNSRCFFFFHNLNLKFGRSISNGFGLTLLICHSSSDSKIWSPMMCSDLKRLKMLVFMHIYSFLMSYDSSNVILVTLKLSYRTICQERLIVTYLWVSLIFNWIIHLIVCILSSILNP